MDLSIRQLSKVFNQKSVFANLTFEIKSGSRFAITGSNGSGKSTLLKILSGGMLPSSGNILYSHGEKKIDENSLYSYVHFVAPYNTVIEELTLSELFHFHQKLGLLKQFASFSEWMTKLDFHFNPDQQVKLFSSGMKQRVKLGLVMLDDRPLILLDEPTSNLDEQGKSWFTHLLGNLNGYQTLIIASNEEQEINLCNDQLFLQH